MASDLSLTFCAHIHGREVTAARFLWEGAKLLLGLKGGSVFGLRSNPLRRVCEGCPLPCRTTGICQRASQTATFSFLFPTTVVKSVACGRSSGFAGCIDGLPIAFEEVDILASAPQCCHSPSGNIYRSTTFDRGNTTDGRVTSSSSSSKCYIRCKSVVMCSSSVRKEKWVRMSAARDAELRIYA